MKGIVGAAAVVLLGALPGAAEAGTADQWSGLYFGGQAGYAMAVTAEGYSSRTYWTEQSQGATAGVFAGYNFLPGGNWLAGFEVEGNWSDLQAQYYDRSYGGPYYIHDWSAAGRLRLGYLTAPNTLLFGSVGLAAGDFDFSQGQWGYNGYGATKHTLAGVQIGAGIETFVAPNFSVRAEGVFTQYGTGWIDSAGSPYYAFQPTSLVARVGIAYHPGWMAQSAAPAAKEIKASWSGFYAGGDVGTMLLGSAEDSNPQSSPPNDPAYSIGAWSGEIGAHAGFNWQAGALVAGLEANAFAMSPTIMYSDYWYGKQTWSAAVRARLGLLAMDNTLFYGTIGFAAGGFDYNGYWTNLPGATFTGGGLQLGAGAEAFLTPQLSARIEGLYSDYGKHTILSGGVPYWDVSPRTLEARLGISYHLN
jgi:outer membrane immunogenic protein